MSGSASPSWLTLQEAARAFGVSVKTLRRRISDGTLTAQRDQSNPQARWTIREDSLTELYGEPRETTPSQDQTPPVVAVELKELLDDQRRMIHELQRAHQAEAVAAAKAEHLAERVTEYRDERDDLRAEHDRLILENAALRHRRWWQKRPPEYPMGIEYPKGTPG